MSEILIFGNHIQGYQIHFPGCPLADGWLKLCRTNEIHKSLAKQSKNNFGSD